MAVTLELVTGSDLTLDHDQLRIVRRFRVLGTLPYTLGGDAFDTIASLVMSLIRTDYATYGTDMGTLYWNSIQIHENHYAQHYEISVTYSPVNRQSGSYQIRVEQAVGMEKATTGTLISTYPAAKEIDNEEGVFWDGEKITGVDIPVAEDRIVVSYRHPQAFLIPSYIRAVGKLRGYPNNDTFLGYDPGEVMYMGGDFAQTECEASALYNFTISRNVTDFAVAGITISEKKGFDAISPVYKDGAENNDDGDTMPIREVDRINIIRPAGREWKDYVAVFGWGG